MPLTTIGKLLGHKNVGTTARYAHLTESYLQKANNALGEQLKGIVSEPKAEASTEEPTAPKPRLLDVLIEH